MMFGFIIGLAIGAGAAFVYRLANDDSPITGDTPLDKLRLQAREAFTRARAAAKELA